MKAKLSRNKKKMDDLDGEIAKLKSSIAKSPSTKEENTATQTDPNDAEERSIFCKGVDYAVTNEELTQWLGECGPVERVTIPKDPHTHHPKGFAYVMFATAEGANRALSTKNGQLLHGRAVEIAMKRANVPGMGRGGRGGRMGSRAGGPMGMEPMPMNPMAAMMGQFMGAMMGMSAAGAMGGGGYGGGGMGRPYPTRGGGGPYNLRGGPPYRGRGGRGGPPQF